MGPELMRLFTSNSAQMIFSVWDIITNCALTTILIFIITFAYTKTHRSTNYSQYFVHTLFIMGLVTATIMMIIGSNIARAFTLVGALSIIRFRTAVKDSRDTGFIFLSIAAGMACGTGFYLVGFLSTVFICLLISLLFWMDYGRKAAAEKIIKVECPINFDYEKILSVIFKQNLRYWSLINTERFISQNYTEFTFIVLFKKRVSEQKFIEELGNIAGVRKVQFLYNDQKVEI